MVATARPVPRQPAIPDIDPLQAQLNLLLANYRVQSAALPQIERKIALVVGVDQYADRTIPPLDNAVRDARSVARSFETRLGYETIVLENATRASVVGALNRLALTMNPRDSVIVYYAGHGELIETTGLGYWLLADSSAKDPTTWLSNTDINRLVGRINAQQVALLSDSCYSGSLASEDRIRAAPRAPDPQAVLARKTVVVMTSGGNEPVFDEGRDGHSPFAWNLMQTLGKVADWQVGGNVFERIRFAVARALPQRPQYSAARAGGHQPGGDYLFEQRKLVDTVGQRP
ncbi:MAG: caspase family protein [Chitinophagaceae bacterium]|nr:caspase family protein [Rubrivivax sp.]